MDESRLLESLGAALARWDFHGISLGFNGDFDGILVGLNGTLVGCSSDKL